MSKDLWAKCLLLAKREGLEVVDLSPTCQIIAPPEQKDAKEVKVMAKDEKKKSSDIPTQEVKEPSDLAEFLTDWMVFELQTMALGSSLYHSAAIVLLNLNLVKDTSLSFRRKIDVVRLHGERSLKSYMDNARATNANDARGLWLKLTKQCVDLAGKAEDEYNEDVAPKTLLAKRKMLYSMLESVVPGITPEDVKDKPVPPPTAAVEEKKS